MIMRISIASCVNILSIGQICPFPYILRTGMFRSGLRVTRGSRVYPVLGESETVERRGVTTDQEGRAVLGHAGVMASLGFRVEQ
jgi:hypothetical protein